MLDSTQAHGAQTMLAEIMAAAAVCASSEAFAAAEATPSALIPNQAVAPNSAVYVARRYRPLTVNLRSDTVPRSQHPPFVPLSKPLTQSQPPSTHIHTVQTGLQTPTSAVQILHMC